EVEIRPGWIETFLDLQRFSAGELRFELAFDQQLVGAAAKDRELVLEVRFHRSFKVFVTFAKIRFRDVNSGRIIASKPTILAQTAGRSPRQARGSPTRGQWLAVLLFAASSLAAFGLVANTAPELAPIEVIRLDLPQAEFAVVETDDAGYWREDRVRRGDTIGSVLARMGVDD